MKRLEIVQNNKTLATYYWGSKEFVYDKFFFDKAGDVFLATDGKQSMVHEETPYFFTKFLPIKGSQNYLMALKKTGANPHDEFDQIKKFCQKIPASFSIIGFDE